MDSRLGIVDRERKRTKRKKTDSDLKTDQSIFLVRVSFSVIYLDFNVHHPLLFVLFFYRFSHTYAQPIGFSGMHSLSVKCRRFDTFQLLLPFNGPIKLFHSYPFDQSDATPI